MRKTPVVLGTLSVVFGALTGAWSVLAFFIGPMLRKLTEFTKAIPGQAELQEAQMGVATKQLEAQSGYMITSAAVWMLMSVALVIIGVGLYRRRPWARRAAIYWSALGLVELVANFVVAIAWLQPMQRRIQEEVYAAHHLTPAFQLPEGAKTGMLVVGMLLYAVYPTVLMILLGRRSAEGDFIAAPPAA